MATLDLGSVIGPKGEKGDKGDTGTQGPAGAGVVAGGTTGQVLKKKSGTDYDTEWADESGGAVDSVNGQTGTVVLDTDDIDDTSASHKFVTASDVTNLSNLSGANSGDQSATDFDIKDLTDSTGLRTTWSGKQDALGYTAANDSATVHNTGNETVNGVKTFGSFPVTPSSAPASDYQAANKKYADDGISSHLTAKVHFRPIANTTLGSAVSSITISQDVNSQSFSLKRARLSIYIPGASYTSIRLRYNSISTSSYYDAPSGSLTTAATIGTVDSLFAGVELTATLIGGNVMTSGLMISSDTTPAIDNGRIVDLLKSGSITGITSFTLYLGSGNLPTGTVIKIDGVDA